MVLHCFHVFLQIIVILGIVHYNPHILASNTNKTSVLIGYLTVDKTDVFMRGKQGRAISGALTLAVEQINADPTILPNHRLEFIWGDTMANTLVSTKLLTDQWRRGAVAFIGLEDSCSVEAKVAAAWNLPMISYKCADADVSSKVDFPTFARTFPPASQVAKPIISLLLHYNWSKFTLIKGSLHKFSVIANRLKKLAKEHNISINQEEPFDEPHLPLTTGNPFPGIVERTFVDTRVYVFLGTYNGIVDMMTNMYDRGLLDTGEYVVIYYDHETVDTIDPLKFYRRTTDDPKATTNKEAVRSLLVITGSPPSNPGYEEFKRKVNEYDELEPFSFPNPFPNTQRKITVYAAYLYDAVILYAKAVHQVLKEGGNLTDGKAIIDKILDSNYTGIQGFISQIDENGDGVGNFTLLARQPYISNLSEFSMRPVGHFQMEKINKTIPIYKQFDGIVIEWVSGAPPVDEPPCGYRGERCIPAKTYTIEITGGVIGGLALVILVVALFVYRNWRYEQEIAGLLWRIPREDLKTSDSPTGCDRRGSIGSRMSLTQLSVDSRMTYTQVFARTGSYRGQIVALKMYEKHNLYISRKMQKEMKLMRDLRHTNINPFLGACIDPPSFIIVTDYCPKGSLQDILENEDLKLDDMFVASLVKDITQGMIFLHDSEIGFHGNLKSSNCVVNSRWSLQITDFGLLEVRAATYRIEDQHAFYRNMFWRAPEHIRNTVIKGSQKGDVYSFGIILHEMFGRAGPYGFSNMSPKEIIERVRMVCVPPFRPDVKALNCERYKIDCMEWCWNEDPEKRPDFRTISKILRQMRHGMKRNIFDNMMAMMEKYQRNLEDVVEERTTQLIEEKKKTEALLLRMLPKCVADQLKHGEAVIPESYDSVTIYFSDICSFTKLSADSTPMQVVDMLNDLYTLFDNTIRNFDVYKIETIGDAYMVCSGLPLRNGDNHAGEIASMSLELLRKIQTFRIRHRPDHTISLRIGIHSGPCAAGVVGLTMPRYTLFGDTVNTASRMETNGEPMKIHCSEYSKALLDKLGGYTLEPRGTVSMKGKGEVFTYWLQNEDTSVRSNRIKTVVPKDHIPVTPYTPNSSTKFCHGKVKGSPKVNRSPKCKDIDMSSCLQETNILDLLRETDGKSLRNESPKHFLSSSLQKDTASSHSVLHGQGSGGFLGVKKPVNGLMTDFKGRSVSGLELNSPTNTVDVTQDVNDRLNESDTLLVRHHSLGPKPHWKQKCLLPSDPNNCVGLKIEITSDENPLSETSCV